MKHAFVDTGNNILHIITDPRDLQGEFDKFVVKVRAQGKMDLCVGCVHLVLLTDLTPETGLLHHNPARDSGWDVKSKSPLIFG